MKPGRILVFRIGSLGDMLVSLPAFWRLRQSFPDAHIALLSNLDSGTPGAVDVTCVLPENGLFDEFISYPSDVGKFISVGKAFELIRTLRRRKFDSVYYLMNRTRGVGQIRRDRFFFRLCGIRILAGFGHLLANRLEINAPYGASPVARESEFLLECVSSDPIALSGLTDIRSDPGLTENEREQAAEWLKQVMRNASEMPVIAVAPGSKWSSKIWPKERFAEVVLRLIRSRDVFPIVFGGPEDRGTGERLLTWWGRGANAAGELSVRQAAAALGMCSLFVGNDTGTMHLAAAVGTPCVALFASIDWPGRWYPLGTANRILRHSIECEGCHLAECPYDNRCIKLSTVESVVSECLQLLDAPSGNTAIS